MAPKSRDLPFNHLLGVARFGVLSLDHGPTELVETVRFDDTEGIVISLESGHRRAIRHAGHAHRFLPVPMEEAARMAGMPVPVTQQVGDMKRRIDPFHSDRHLNQDFRTLVAIIYRHRLPCGYALLKYAGGGWDDAAFLEEHREDPEIFVASATERLYRDLTLTFESVLRTQLAVDCKLDEDDPTFGDVLDRSGWQSVLDRLDIERVLAMNAPMYPTMAAA